MSLFRELKRRNVFRVGIAYAVAAWIILQLTDVVGEILELPPWGGKLILVLLAVGFVIALIVAWAFELTPEGLKRDHEVDRSQSIAHQTGKRLNNAILVLMALAIVYLLWDKFSNTDPDPQVTTTPAVEPANNPAEPLAAEPAGPARASIAVLPFANRSRLEEDKFFVEGIHDDLLTNLARIGSLKVISRTSVLRYQDTEKPIPEIAEELGVSAVMEGAVQRSGDTVRINVQLIDAATDEHLWAEIFDRQLSANNLFAIQSEISQAIADALQATLSPEERDRISQLPTEDLAAYNAYLQGRQLMATRQVANLQKARDLFVEATERDPRFAQAWIGLGEADFHLSNYGSLPVSDAMRQMKQAVDTALTLNPELGEAYALLAQWHEFQQDYTSAEAAFNRAIDLNPNDAQTYHWLSGMLGHFQLRSDERLAAAQRAVELDPGSALIANNLASAYVSKGLLQLAEREYQKVIALNPELSIAYQGLSSLYAFGLGRLDLALEANAQGLAVEPNSPFYLGWRGVLLLELNETEAAEAYVERIDNLRANDWRADWLEVQIEASRGNAEAVRQLVRALTPRVTGFDFAGYLLAETELAMGDAQEARRLFLTLDSGWDDPAQWEALLGRQPDFGCVVAWTLGVTGNPGLAEQLTTATLDYLENRLPQHNEHADNWRPEVCYLNLGDIDHALAIIQTRLDHNHLMFWTWDSRLPMFEPLRHDSRYQAALAERNQRIEEQRQAVRAESGMAL